MLSEAVDEKCQNIIPLRDVRLGKEVAQFITERYEMDLREYLAKYR